MSFTRLLSRWIEPGRLGPSDIGSVKRWKLLFSLDVLFLCFVAGVTFWGYYDILDDFFIMDDFDMIRGHSTFRQFFEHWRSPVGGGMYRPLIDLLFIWDFYWSGWNPLGWHLSNLLFHIFNSLLVYALAKHLTYNSYTALAAGVLFGLHTSHTEAVTWISARMDVVCATFFLLSVWFFVQRRFYAPDRNVAKRFLFLSVVCFMCALLIKEMGVMLPFVLMTYDWIFSPDRKLDARHLRKTIRLFFPYFLVLLVYFPVRLSVLGGIDGGYISDWFGVFILENLVWYFKFLATPFSETIFSASLFVNVTGILVFTGVCLFLSPQSRFLILWIWLTLVPVYMLNIGRGVYLASVGFCILFGMLLTFTLEERTFMPQQKFVRTALRVMQVVLLLAVFARYEEAIRLSNAWWSEVAAINEQVPLKVKALHPSLPDDTKVCLQNVPLVFNQRFHHAFTFRYMDDDLSGVYVKNFEKCVKNATADEIAAEYFFLYYRDNIVYDMTIETRERLDTEQPIKIQKIPRRPEYKISKEHPRIEIALDADTPYASLGVVTSLANGIGVQQGTVVAHGRIEGAQETLANFELTAGENTAEWAIRFPQVQRVVLHENPQNVYRAWTVQQSEGDIRVAQNYIMRVSLPPMAIPKKCSIEFHASDAVPEGMILDIDRLLLYPVQTNKKILAEEFPR